MEIGNGNGISAAAGGSETRDADAPRRHLTRNDRLGNGLFAHGGGRSHLRGARRALARRSHARADRGGLRRLSAVLGLRNAGARVDAPPATLFTTRQCSRPLRLADASEAGIQGGDRRPAEGAAIGSRNCAASRKRRCPVVSVERRPPRIPRTIASDLAGWLHRVRTVHGWLHSGVNVYARPETAGGRSLAGDNHAARAAAGDRSLLHDLLTRSVQELEAVRDEVWAAMTPGPLTSQPGTPERINELARRVAAGQTLHTESDRRRWC